MPSRKYIKKIYEKQKANFKKPTPKKYKRIGLALRLTGRVVAGLALIPALSAAWWIPFAAFVVGETGKFVTDLKTE
jgi:hypothetical protein